MWTDFTAVIVNGKGVVTAMPALVVNQTATRAKAVTQGRLRSVHLIESHRGDQPPAAPDPMGARCLFGYG